MTAQATLKPAQRWAPLARQIDPALTRAHDWGALADTIERTHRAGGDVRTLLPIIAAQAALSPDEPAKDLRYRLAAHLDPPDEPIPPRPAARPARPGLERPSAAKLTPTPGRPPASSPAHR